MKKSFVFTFKLLSVICGFVLFVNNIQAQSAASKSVLVTVGNPAGCPIGGQAATYYQPYVLMYRGNIIGGTAQNIYSCQVAWAPASPTDYPDTYFSTFIEFDPAANDLIITKAKNVTNDSTRVYVAGFATNTICDPVNLNFVQPSGVRMNGLIADPAKRHQILLSSGAYNLSDLNLATGNNTNLKPITYVPIGSDPSTAPPNGWDIAFTSDYQSIYWLIHEKLYRIDNVNSTSPTAYFLLDLPIGAGDSWVGVAYYNNKVLLGKINLTSGGCTVAEWDPVTSTLSAQVTFPSSDGFVDFTSFTTSVGAAKKLISATQVAGTTYDLVFEVFGKNLGTTPLNNFQIVDDLSGVFGALNIVSISAINAVSNPAGLTINSAFNGTTDKNLIAANQTLPNFINNSITLQFTVRVKNASPGITYFNYAIASGNARNGQSVQDISNDYSGFGETANQRVDIDLNQVADDPTENNATPWSLPDDTENDGIPFYVDIDDDNDGIVDTLECPRTLTPSSFANGSFETPVLGSIASNKVFNGTAGLKWKTTTPSPNDYVEVWSGGFGATPTVCGSQIIELNASGIGAIYQKFKIPPSATIKWTMKHRGRFGTDIARVSLGTALDSLTTTYLLSDGNAAWGSYTGYYSAPAYADSVVMSIASLSNAAPVTTFNPDTVGNLIDCVTIEVIDVPCSTDSDGDQLIDSRDLDSDNDGIPDLVEAGGVDVNGDGSADVVIDSDADGLIDAYDSTTGGTNIGLVDGDGNQYTLLDTDGDGVPNFRDIDSDNDGITDATEVGATDANGDGRVDNASETDFDGLADAYDGDVGNDGTAEATANAVLPTLADANADGKPEGYTKGNFDNDNYLNHLDIDSDNDGITDNTEGQATATYIAPSGNDTDGDGLDNAYDINNGGLAVVPVNTDNTDNPDYLDLDTDNDTRTDVIEGHDSDGDGLPDAGSPASTGINNNTTTDADADGLLDVYDNNTSSKDPTNGGLNPTSHPDVQKPGGDRDWRSLTKDVRIAKLISPASIYNGLIVFHNPNGTAGAHIFTCNPGGSNEKVVASAVDPEYDPVFFPSGSKIMWARSGVDFWIMNPDGTNPTLFKAVTAPAQTYQANPSFKRDETEYVFVSQSSNSSGDLFITKVAGGIPNQLTFSPGFENHPSYSADGSKIYYDYDFGGDQELYVMNADGTNPQQLTNTAGRNARPSVSPDGTKIIFMSSRDGNNEIYVMNIDGSNPVRVTNSTTTDDVEPKWAPDGKKVLFSRATAFPDFDIYFVDPLVGETSVTPARPTQPGFTFDPKQQSLILTGSTITYKVLISNDATTSANVNFNDVLPANTTFVSASAPAGWSISTPTVGSAGGTVSGSNVALPVGTDTITITVKLDQKYALDKTVLANTASITSPDDDFPSNNSSTSNNFIASDKDLDGIPDYIDIDDDNDGILDLVEAPSDPLADADNDGTPNQSDPQFCTSAALNSNGMCAEFDTDGDGVPNHLDIDADNDGITDVTEAGGSDPDNNGQIGIGLGTTIADTDSDGYADVVDTDNGGTALNPPNTDVSGKPNYVDIDADGDGIVDNIEGQSTSGYVSPTGVDADEDGLDDAYDSVVGFSGNGVTPNNNDATDNPDYIDLDTDNDGVADNIEGWDINGSGVINGTEKTASGVDADNDGLDDGYDANTSAVNPTNSTTPTSYPDVIEVGGDRDWREFNDHDNDGIANGTDLDDDNDGILDTDENCGTLKAEFNGTFGVLPNSLSDPINNNRRNLQSPVNGYSYISSDLGLDTDTRYCVVNKAGILNMHSLPLAFRSIAGHTTGTNEDAYLAVNGSTTQGVFFSETVILSKNNDYNFGAWAVNANDTTIPFSLVNAEIGIRIKNSQSVIIASASTGILLKSNDWQLGQSSFNTGNENIFTIEMYNISMTGAGNDFYVDDVFLNPINCDDDFDNDGLVDSYDLDSDNDGIPDLYESDRTPTQLASLDANNDGVIDGAVGANGIPDAGETTVDSGVSIVSTKDSDGDGHRDHLDLDADNDGITDVIESGHAGLDANGDGVVDGTDTDNDGIINVSAIDNNSTFGGSTISNPDFDGDGKPNTVDLDADNDGITDVKENNGTDADNDGMADGTDIDNDGIVSSVDSNVGFGGSPITLINTDSFGNSNFLDIDADNDGIVDNIEGQSTTGYVAPTGTDTDGDGIDNAYDTTVGFGGAGVTPNNKDGADNPDYTDLDSDNDGRTDVIEGWDINNSGTITGTEKIFLGVDVDNDGLDDGFDSNTSGVNPTNGTTPTSYPDVDKPGGDRDWREILDHDNDGVTDVTDLDDDNDGVPDTIEGSADTDGDGIKDSFDLDSDNDGIPDVIEAGGTDANGDGIIDGFVDTDNDGLSDTVDTTVGGTPLTNPDTDSDGKSDTKDLDADNDGITDVREAGGTDANGDGVIDGFTDTDNDGLSDNIDPVGPTVVGTPITIKDSDGDGRKDYVDLDSDNDGITDVRENGQTSLDANNDGMIDGTDTDGDGIINATGVDINSTYGGTTATLVNSDSDNKPDYVDIDSDNDGIVDNVEGQSTSGYVAPTGVDTDGDGIDNAYDTTVGFGGAGVTPNNQDGTDNPDYTDLDTDNDGRLDTQEGWDTNGDGIISGGEKTATGVDADNDGLDDGYDNNSTASNPTNSTTPTSYPDVDLPGNDRDWREIPGVIGVAKSVSTPILNADGTYSITYKVVVKNLGVGAMGNISVVENLSATFPTPTTYTITAFPTVTPAGTGLTLNGGFNGSTQTSITAPTSSSIGGGRTDTITFTVKVKPNGYFGPFNNTVTISGNNGGIAVTDSSTTGNNPDPNGNGKPNDPGENIATPVTFTPNSIIGVAKSASTPEPSGTGLSYVIVYKIKVKNYGNDTLKNVQVIDDLDAAIPSPATYTVSGISATGTVNANIGYNGSSVTGLLNASTSKLNPGDSATITFTIVVTPNGLYSVINSATATGTGQLGNTVSDVSTNGTNPDKDGDGNPTEDTEDEQTVTVLPPIEFSIPEGFSPNDDGVNDNFVIKGIARYPKNKFTVMNRWGNVVYEASGYMDTWNGKANVGTHIGTDELPVGTYFYILDLGNNSTPLKGYIYLNR